MDKKNKTRDNEKNLPSCCRPKKEYKGKNVFKGIMYGLIPHIGCIMFILAAVLGATILMQFFKPLLMNRNIFYYLILISLGFATLSSFFYLRKNKCLCWKGIKSKKGYLTIMYGSTVGINILLFFFIFPFLANVGNVSAAEITGASVLGIAVDIPCPGHAPLISNELKTIKGVKGTEYSFPNKFDVYYNNSETSKEEILDLEVFEEYPAEILSEELFTNKIPEQTSSVTQTGCCGSSSCSAGGSGGCGCGGY